MGRISIFESKSSELPIQAAIRGLHGAKRGKSAAKILLRIVLGIVATAYGIFRLEFWAG